MVEGVARELVSGRGERAQLGQGQVPRAADVARDDEERRMEPVPFQRGPRERLARRPVVERERDVDAAAGGSHGSHLPHTDSPVGDRAALVEPTGVGKARLHREPATECLVDEAEVREPLFSPVPTLFVSGTMDANTPPFNAEELMWGFPNGRHVMVVNAFHETLVSPAVQQWVVDFFGGKSPDANMVQFDQPRFLSLEEARTAALRSR